MFAVHFIHLSGKDLGTDKEEKIVAHSPDRLTSMEFSYIKELIEKWYWLRKNLEE